MDYFLVSIDGWRMTADDFVPLLLAKYPGAQLEHVADPADNRCLEFRVPMSLSTLHGALDREGTALIFFGAIPDCAGFVLWYRSLVPPGKRLLLCEEGGGGNLPVEPETTQEDILRALQYRPSS